MSWKKFKTSMRRRSFAVRRMSRRPCGRLCRLLDGWAVAWLRRSGHGRVRLMRERQRELGELASGIAHDINNSISPATLHLESLLERESGLGEPVRERLEIIRRAVQEVARTVRRMQEIARRRRTGRPVASIPRGDSSGVIVVTAPEPRVLRILVVDDNANLLETLSEVLSADGHQVTATTGGAEGIAAFQAARESGAPYGLVLTDLGMPQVDGRQVAAAIKEMAPATPVVLLTGWGHRMVTGPEELANIDLVLAKPPRLKDLRQALLRLATV